MWTLRTLRPVAVSCFFGLTILRSGLQAQEPRVISLWNDQPPGPAAVVDGEEVDRTREGDQLIAGRRVARIGNVSHPVMQVFLPPSDKANGAACVVCPGGGFSILAWDLEGTEVADWLTAHGLAAIVVKYRVPTRQHEWPGMLEGPVMDTQRALSLTRQHAAEWNIDGDRIGVLGFSAGGATAAATALKAGDRAYEPRDDTDQFSCSANFAVLVYPGAITGDDGLLRTEYTVTEQAPPVFFVHAADDPVNCNNSIVLFQALRAADRSAELHIFHTGGHGYGLRATEAGVTRWPDRALTWLTEQTIVPPQPAPTDVRP